MIFAVLIFKESVGVIRWFAALISFLGGLILIRPTLDLNVDPVAVLCLWCSNNGIRNNLYKDFIQ